MLLQTAELQDKTDKQMKNDIDLRKINQKLLMQQNKIQDTEKVRHLEQKLEQTVNKISILQNEHLLMKKQLDYSRQE